MLHFLNKKEKIPEKQENIRDFNNIRMIQMKNQEMFLLKKEELV